jgi:PIN domain nuclease of toxin-antitoxin system
MELMLDTCGFLSLVGLSERPLGKTTLGVVEEAESIYISACSLFEIAIKHKKGNIAIQPFGSAMELWGKAIEEYQLTELPVSAGTFYDSTALPDVHGDPFDRIIIAEALSRKIPIVSYDAIFGRYGVETIN